MAYITGTNNPETLRGVYYESNTIGGLGGDDTILGDAYGDYLSGDDGNDLVSGGGGIDTIFGNTGFDSLFGDDGNDVLTGGTGNDYLDGGSDIDTAAFNINHTAVIEVRHLKAGGAYIVSNEGIDTLISIETLSFLNGIVTNAGGDVISNLIALRPIPTFAGATTSVTLYAGTVSFLEYENLGTAAGNIVAGSINNDFINLFAGDDAANGNFGDDVLDGGTGSNFLSGGGGNDTLFLDGRGGTITWSTITDFNSGDEVNIWGWNAGSSKLLLTEATGGGSGYTGATFHYDLNNDNTIDTSVTFTGLALAQVPNSQALTVSGNGYLLIG